MRAGLGVHIPVNVQTYDPPTSPIELHLQHCRRLQLVSSHCSEPLPQTIMKSLRTMVRGYQNNSPLLCYQLPVFLVPLL